MSDLTPGTPIGIIGLGLIGGSLAKALKRTDPTIRVVGCDTDPATRAAAAAAGVIDEAVDVVDARLQPCRTVVIATPLPALETILTALQPHLDTATLLTDVIGVKRAVAEAVRRHLPEIPFVGGHPMAGGIQGGFSLSRGDLFDGCQVALCPEAQTAAEPLANFWQRLGAKPQIMTAETHDRIVAFSSHLPYLAAVALTETLAASGDDASLAGRGLRDATRHAAFQPEVMASVCAANPELPNAARKLARELESLAELAESDPASLHARAVRARRRAASLAGKLP